MRALVTGFEAFGGDTVNASLIAVMRLPAHIGALEIATAALPTSFARAADLLKAAIARIEPDLVLCVGEAGERAVLSVESVAINLCSARIADNDGALPVETAVIAGGPAAYFATLPVGAIAHALGAAGLPAEISNSAGTYVCNQVFYRLMHQTADAGHRWLAGFMHVPHAFDAAARPQAKMPLDDIVRGIHIALEISAAH
jgi:pyroglutamyl-peptidase